MKIRVYSDCHWEHSVRTGVVFMPTPLDTDKDTILVLAGDLHNGLKSIGIIKEFHKRFKGVVVVLGNHDYWGQNYENLTRQYKEALIEHNMSNVHLLQNEGVQLDGYLFVGSTFWTDMNKSDPFVIEKAKWVMQMDYTNIRYKEWWDSETTGLRHCMFTPELWLEEHKLAFDTIKSFTSQAIPTVLVTHHPGSMLAISEAYKQYGNTNYLWASEYGNWVANNPNIKMWFSGHTHTPHNFVIGETQFVGNPIGYPGEQRNWDDIALYELPDIT